MYAALAFVAHVIAATPAPTQVVLEGCNTASAIRVAEIRLTSPEDVRMRSLLDLALRHDDAATCLVESDVLVDIHKAGHDKDLVMKALDRGLASAPHVAARAGEVAAKIRVFDPAAYDELVRKGDKTSGEAMSAPREVAHVR